METRDYCLQFQPKKELNDITLRTYGLFTCSQLDTRNASGFLTHLFEHHLHWPPKQCAFSNAELRSVVLEFQVQCYFQTGRLIQTSTFRYQSTMI